MLWIKVPSDAHTQATRAGTHLYFRLKQQMCTINLGQIALETFLPCHHLGWSHVFHSFFHVSQGVWGGQLSAWPPEQSMPHLTLTVLRDVCFQEHMNPCPVTAPAVPPSAHPSHYPASLHIEA